MLFRWRAPPIGENLVWSEHRVRLAGSRLTIRHEAHVKTLRDACHTISADDLVHILLCRCFVKHMVEREFEVPHHHRLWWCTDADAVLAGRRSARHGAEACVHTNWWPYTKRPQRPLAFRVLSSIPVSPCRAHRLPWNEPFPCLIWGRQSKLLRARQRRFNILHLPQSLRSLTEGSDDPLCTARPAAGSSRLARSRESGEEDESSHIAECMFSNSLANSTHRDRDWDRDRDLDWGTRQ